MSGEGNIRQLRGAQLGLITASRPALQASRFCTTIRRLSKRQKRRETETKTGYLHPKIFPETCFHLVRLPKDSFYR